MPIHTVLFLSYILMDVRIIPYISVPKQKGFDIFLL